MSDTIVLDTPAQISMWVLLSRRHQVQLHMKGLKVKGIMACLKREFGDHGNRVANYVLPIEHAIANAGGEVDYKLVNVHVMVNRGGMLFDRGVFANMDDAGTDTHKMWHEEGILALQLTSEDVREANGEIYVFDD